MFLSNCQFNHQEAVRVIYASVGKELSILHEHIISLLISSTISGAVIQYVTTNQW